MILHNFYITVLFILLFSVANAQEESIALDEVIITDTQLRDFTETQTVLHLSDTVIRRNGHLLTSLLEFNSGIYMKEHGIGGVSSPSFRGTSSQQTAVVWNGININSQLLGQTDFNTVSTRSFESIDIKAGGGSVLYGSGAIGGTIHLNNTLQFGESFNNDLQVYYGADNTLSTTYSVKAASAKWSASAGLTRNSSDNDYKFIGKEQRNTNGQYFNNSFDAAVAYKFNRRHQLEFFSQLNDGERHFAITSPNAIRTKYQDFNTRNLLSWSFKPSTKVSSKLKLAYISEEYHYFDDIRKDNYLSSGEVKTVIAKYDFSIQLLAKAKLNAIVDYSHNSGLGSGITENIRESVGASVLWKHDLGDRLGYEVGLRKESASDFESPLLFSAGTYYDVFSFYRVKINASKNYRIPTFNDLYWQEGGNPNLKPENTLQAELINVLSAGPITFTATGYLTKVKDMIRWLPTNESFWSPFNTDRVSIMGAEAAVEYGKNIGNHTLNFRGGYSYTSSKDEKTNKQLFYVPYHKLTGSADYAYKKFAAYYQIMFTGMVFTTSDENPQNAIADYNLSNIGIDYNSSRNNIVKIGLKLNNAWNEKYNSLDQRPMPGRNLTFYLNLNY